MRVAIRVSPLLALLPVAATATLLCAQPIVEPTPTPAPTAPFKIGGYAEVFASHNFNDPANGITQSRGFDAREDRLSIDNLAVDASATVGRFNGKLTLQAGLTPDTYYAAEPGDRAWRHVQQAFAGYNAPVGNGLLIEGGIFLSPIGPEGIAVKDNGSWSRSDLFFGLPFYHAGVRVTYPLSASATAMVMVTNGWNDVKDNNGSKALMLQLLLKGPKGLEASVLYMGGSERPTGSSEGQPWRNLLDAWWRWKATDGLALMVHADGGFEENAFGRSSWVTGALYGRYALRPVLSLAARGDVFWESVPAGAAPIFWSGASRVASATLTVDVRPFPDHLAVMLEARRDWATAGLYFEGTGTARAQTTVTLGVTGWF